MERSQRGWRRRGNEVTTCARAPFEELVVEVPGDRTRLRPVAWWERASTTACPTRSSRATSRRLLTKANSILLDRRADRPMEIDARTGVIARPIERVPTPLNAMAVAILQASVATDAVGAVPQPG